MNLQKTASSPIPQLPPYYAKILDAIVHNLNRGFDGRTVCGRQVDEWDDKNLFFYRLSIFADVPGEPQRVLIFKDEVAYADLYDKDQYIENLYLKMIVETGAMGLSKAYEIAGKLDIK